MAWQTPAPDGDVCSFLPGKVHPPYTIMRYPATEATLKIDPAVKREIRCDRPEAVILVLVKSSDFCHFDFPRCHFEAKREISCCRGCLSQSG